MIKGVVHRCIVRNIACLESHELPTTYHIKSRATIFTSSIKPTNHPTRHKNHHLSQTQNDNPPNKNNLPLPPPPPTKAKPKTLPPPPAHPTPPPTPRTLPRTRGIRNRAAKQTPRGGTISDLCESPENLFFTAGEIQPGYDAR